VRAFVALEVSGREREDADAKAPEHLTLEFLGDVLPESVPRIVDRLRPVARAIAPFGIRLEGVGAFPKPSEPRVVWVDVTEGRGELAELARRVRDALQGVVPAPRGEFVPHLTLFRVRTPSDRRRALELLDGRRAPPPPRDVAAREFVLKESVLGPGGAVHRTIEAFPLSGPEGG
jgi:RNA 2',3'-cyclic 3'-phosphodiesterase